MSDPKPINPHPGQLLKSEIIKPRKLTVRKSAEILAINEDYLHKIIAGTRDINLGMCCRLEQLFGENAEVWATRQMLHDLEKKRSDVQKLNIQPYNTNCKISDENFTNTHPGQLLKSQVLEPRKLKAIEAAKLFDITRNHLNRIISGERDINLELCCRLEQLFGENAEVWATRQMLLDLGKKRAEVKKLNIQPYSPEQ